jgi:hypothetical protein
MDQVADIVIGNIFTTRNFRIKLRFACGELFEPDRCACNRLYDNAVRCLGILILEDEFAGSPTGSVGNGVSSEMILSWPSSWDRSTNFSVNIANRHLANVCV